MSVHPLISNVVIAGLATYRECFDGTYDLEDLFDLNEILALKGVIELRAAKRSE